MALGIRNERAETRTLEEIMAISLRCRNLPDIDTRSPDTILGYSGTGNDRRSIKRSPDPKRKEP